MEPAVAIDSNAAQLRVLRLTQVMRVTGLCRSMIYRLESEQQCATPGDAQNDLLSDSRGAPSRASPAPRAYTGDEHISCSNRLDGL